MQTLWKARQLSQGAVPEHLRLDFLQARQAVETRFFHGEPGTEGRRLWMVSSGGLPCSEVGDGPEGCACGCVYESRRCSFMVWVRDELVLVVVKARVLLKRR